MNRGHINICGITPKHCFPECLPQLFTQFCETDKLNIVGNDPDMEEIVEIRVRVSIRNFKTLCTSFGKKLIVHAVKNIEIVFKNKGINYTSRFCIPFCAFVLLDEIDEKVTAVHFIIEDIDVFQVSGRCVAVSSLIVVIPDFKCQNDEWKDRNTIRCDIKLKGC